MFWGKKSATEQLHAKVESLAGPVEIPQQVGRYLAMDLDKDTDWVWKLKAVERRRPSRGDAFDIRVYDETQAAVRQVTVMNYTSLDTHSDLILFHGWYERGSLRLQIEQNGKGGSDRVSIS